MAFSINVNASALAALTNLNKTTKELNVTQNRINTGLKIATAKDNAAVFSIAQKLRADLKGYNAVRQSVDRGISTVDVALAAAGTISDLLIDMKEKAVAAADPGLDTTSRVALSQDFTALRDQISTIITNSSFNGSNLIDGDVAQTVISAITNPDATQQLTVGHENMALSSLSVGGIITITAAWDLTTLGNAQSAVTRLVTSLDNVNAALTRLGSGATALEQNRTFADKLSDVIEIGIGNLVDADMAKESASLQALQVKQQLGIQALSIANQAPQSVLSLFQ